jgi:hypothetical protein
MEIHFTSCGGRVHVSTAPSRPLGSLQYDLPDFADEFSNLSLGDGLYRVDARLQRFLTHMFGGRE